jgi:hypothetical protein
VAASAIFRDSRVRPTAPQELARTSISAQLWNDANLDRLGLALKDLQVRLKIGEGSIETLHVGLDARTIRRFEIGAWRSIASDADVDVLGYPAR